MKNWPALLQPYKGKKIIVKYGGAAMRSIESQRNTANTAKTCKQHHALVEDLYHLQQAGALVAVVHGGGHQVSQQLKEKDIACEFIDGLRVTSQDVFEIVQMVLCGIVNPEIVGELESRGVCAVGLNGKDGAFIKAHKKQSAANLGFVGEVQEIQPRLIRALWQQGFFPIIAPVGMDIHGQGYNINADTAAAAIAIAVKADIFLSLSDVDGVNFQNETMPFLNANEAQKLIELNFIQGGMQPKVEGLIQAVQHNVRQVQLSNGTIDNPILNGIQQIIGTRFA